MKTADRQKICSQCDGRIPFEANECPYCGMEFTPSDGNSSQSFSFKQQTIHDTLSASLYAPPYPAARSEPAFSHAEPKKSAPFQGTPSFQETAPLPATHNEEETSTLDERIDFWALLLLTVAATSMVLGLLQFFFSDNGTLTLEWNSSYWFLYCLAGLPLFYFGFKKINQI